MNPVTREWIKKAEADYGTAHRELRVRRQPNYEGVCFHAQQCGEKYLKARLHAAGIRFPKTHDLSALLDLAVTIESEWELLRAAAELLTDYAVRFRYPGAAATKAKARQAVESCELVRERTRLALRLRSASSRPRAARKPATRGAAAGKPAKKSTRRRRGDKK